MSRFYCTTCSEPVSMNAIGMYVHAGLPRFGCARMSDTAATVNGDEHDPQDDCFCEYCEGES